MRSVRNVGGCGRERDLRVSGIYAPVLRRHSGAKSWPRWLRWTSNGGVSKSFAIVYNGLVRWSHGEEMEERKEVRETQPARALNSRIRGNHGNHGRLTALQRGAVTNGSRTPKLNLTPDPYFAQHAGGFLDVARLFNSAPGIKFIRPI
jgi:hypothetical protein